MSIESAFLAATPDDTPDGAAIMAALPDAPDPVTGDLDAPPPVDLMTEDEFCAAFVGLHYMGQSLIEAKTGQDTCPLGAQASSEGGQKAAGAAYRSILAVPFLARMMLPRSGGRVTDLFAVAMHVYLCRNLVQSALAAPKP